MSREKKNEKTTETEKPQTITIKAANLQVLSLLIEGTAPYVQHKFSEKAKRQIPHVRLGGRLVRFERDKLDAWVAAHAVPVQR